jgi:hypothetical protein
MSGMPVFQELGFTRDEFARAFRRLGVSAAEADTAAGSVVESPIPDQGVDADVLAALSLVSLECERRVLAWIQAMPPDRQHDLAPRLARGRLHFGGRPIV